MIGQPIEQLLHEKESHELPSHRFVDKKETSWVRVIHLKWLYLGALYTRVTCAIA